MIPKKEGGQRVIEGTVFIKGQELELHRKYNICTTGYMALGKDGYDTICDAKVIIDEENGPELMDIIKEYLEFPKTDEIREDYDAFRKEDRTTALEVLEECYDRKAQKKNMYIASISEAVNQSFVVGLLGRSKTIKSDKNIKDAMTLATDANEGEEVIVAKRTIKDMEAIQKETGSELSVIELLAQNGDVNTIRRYMKYFLANSYVKNVDGHMIWSIDGMKQGSCVGKE